jgi:hypothetical protein
MATWRTTNEVRRAEEFYGERVPDGKESSASYLGREGLPASVLGAKTQPQNDVRGYGPAIIILALPLLETLVSNTFIPLPGPLLSGRV